MPYMVLEYLEGATLRDSSLRDKRMRAGRASSS